MSVNSSIMLLNFQMNSVMKDLKMNFKNTEIRLLGSVKLLHISCLTSDR